MSDDRSRWRVIAPGLYEGPDGSVHLLVPEFLKANGIPDTQDNRDLVATMMGQVAKEKWPGITVDVRP